MSFPSNRGRKTPFGHDKALRHQRHKVENLLAKPRGWRRSATRNDRCARAFVSAHRTAAVTLRPRSTRPAPGS